MKRALLILTTIIFFASCLKKSTDHTKTYYCIKIDSVWSNKPELNNPYFKVEKGYYNKYSEWQIALAIKEVNARIDTLIRNPDTLRIGYWRMTCEATE